ncbi:AcrR family transcriptional regulator [Schumannella luteola]|uniref:AcrR family transcriptional regulator n=1 Tax=Schumannella luteola TaxID=472059 RepID=A0A852Y5X6_9MICO|nr:AcrR family transcriptional regulator [Schumannella luteola]
MSQSSANRSSTERTLRLRSITQNDVAAVGLDLAREGGLEAVTLRSVASRLGIATMSVYRFVGSKDELLDAVVLIAFDRLELPTLLEGTWQERIIAVMASWRDLLLVHPVVVELLVARPVPAQSAGLSRMIESVLAALEQAGVTGPAAGAAFWQIFSHTLGHVIFETPRRAIDADAQRAASERMRQTATDRGFARTRALATELTDVAARSPLEVSLQHLLDGLQVAQHPIVEVRPSPRG